MQNIAGLDPELYARIERNQRLAATDFYALTDVAMPPEIAAYRQALRDLPQSEDWAPRLAWDELKGVVVLGVGWPEVGNMSCTTSKLGMITITSDLLHQARHV